VPTAQGARAWSQATVRALLMRECAGRRRMVTSGGWSRADLN
jgi:hypothetical protein